MASKDIQLCEDNSKYPLTLIPIYDYIPTVFFPRGPVHDGEPGWKRQQVLRAV